MTLMPMPAGGDVPGIDADAERGRAMWMLAAIVAFVISAWNSWFELRYAVSGRTAAADVTRAYRHSEPGRRRAREFLRVEVAFPSDGQSRQAVLRAPLSSRISAGQQIEIQYLPGSDRVRLRGDHEYLWVAAFFCSTAWIGWSLVRLAREANRPLKRKRRRRPQPSLE